MHISGHHRLATQSSYRTKMYLTKKNVSYEAEKLKRSFCHHFLLLIQASSLGPSLENSSSDGAPFFTAEKPLICDL